MKKLFLIALFFVLPLSAFADSIYNDAYPGSGGQCCGINGASGTEEMYAGKFTVTGSYDLTSVDLWVYKDNSPSDNVYVEIQSDSDRKSVV